MGLFFTSKKDKLSRKEIDQALSAAGILGASDKAEIRQRLAARGAGGVTAQDVKKVVRDLKGDTSDSVDRTEANAAKRELLNKLEDE